MNYQKNKLIMKTGINIEKSNLVDMNFDEISWHDCKLYAISFDKNNFRLILDIDYILEWKEPKVSKNNFMFLISPATLIFYNTWDLEISIESNLELEIDRINREDPKPSKNLENIIEYKWKIELQQGEINFRSTEFKLFLRRKPILSESQNLNSEARGEASFSTELTSSKL